MVRCPACGSLLFRRTIGGVAVDGCPGCGGSFYDGGELRGLLERPAALREADRHFVPGLQPAIAPARSDACPRCGKELVRYAPPSLGGAIEADGCRACGGIWLDHGEPTAIAERLAPSPAPATGAAAGPGAATAAAFPSPAGAARSPTAARIAAVVGVPLPAAPAPTPLSPARPLAVAPAASADPTRTAGLPVVRGRRLAGPVEEGGLWGGLTRGLRFFGTAFSLAAERPKLFAPFFAGALLQAALLGALVVGLFAALEANAASSAALWGPESAVPWLHAHNPLLVIGVVLLAFVGHLVNLLVLGVTVSMVDAVLKGREPRFGVAVRDVVKNLGGIVALAVIGTLVNLLAGAIRGSGQRNRGLAGLVLRPLAHAAADLIETAWTVLGVLLLPVIVIEDVGLKTALERVRAIHRGSLLPIAVGEVGLRAVSAIGGLAVVFGLVLFGLALWPLGPRDLVVLVGFAILAATVTGAASAYLRGAYYTCLYLWAAETERAGDPALATVPGPLADALMP